MNCGPFFLSLFRFQSKKHRLHKKPHGLISKKLRLNPTEREDHTHSLPLGDPLPSQDRTEEEDSRSLAVLKKPSRGKVTCDSASGTSSQPLLILTISSPPSPLIQLPPPSPPSQDALRKDWTNRLRRGGLGTRAVMESVPLVNGTLRSRVQRTALLLDQSESSRCPSGVESRKGPWTWRIVS